MAIHTVVEVADAVLSCAHFFMHALYRACESDSVTFYDEEGAVEETMLAGCKQDASAHSGSGSCDCVSTAKTRKLPAPAAAAAAELSFSLFDRSRPFSLLLLRRIISFPRQRNIMRRGFFGCFSFLFLSRATRTHNTRIFTTGQCLMMAGQLKTGRRSK